MGTLVTETAVDGSRDMVRPVFCLLVLLQLCLVAWGEGAGKACQGEGRSTCSAGEFCRSNRCVKVNLKKPGCKNANHCPDNYECSYGVCIRFITEDEKKEQRMAMNQGYGGRGRRIAEDL